MKDRVFSGFIITVSAAMMGIVYGTYTSNMTIVIASEASGLVASTIGWLGFVRDAKVDSKTLETNSPRGT